MSRKERHRLELFSQVKRKELTVIKAAELLELSVRQARRLWKRYREKGDGGLVHRLRGRASNRKIPQPKREQVVSRYQERYGDFGPTHACEKLAREGLAVSPDTLTRLLKEAGLWQRRRRSKKHRSRRARKAYSGEMVQMDGSPHDWFEGRRSRCVLMELVDDATGWTWARFAEEETTESAFLSFGDYVRLRGVPQSLYVDQDTIYRVDKQASALQELQGKEPLTQFGRAMKKLGVRLILAHSPQAKGRVERKHALQQDRLVKEMRLAKISTIEQANVFLEQTYLPQINQRYSVAAQEPADLHRRVKADLSEVLCFEEPRTVGEDWCVRFQNRWLQVDRRHRKLQLAGRVVTVRRKLDGTVKLLSGEQELVWAELPARPQRPKAKPVIRNRQAWVPPQGHPWRRGLRKAG